MSLVTKNVITIYAIWVLVWLLVAGYGALFADHGEFGVSSHLWLTISGLPMSLVSWFITPHGTFVGSFTAGILVLIQWGAIAEANAKWDVWRKSNAKET